ncbi:MAG: hypothetical protein R3Y63_04760 [Eubacteriales bacterium]
MDSKQEGVPPQKDEILQEEVKTTELEALDFAQFKMPTESEQNIVAHEEVPSETHEQEVFKEEIAGIQENNLKDISETNELESLDFSQFHIPNETLENLVPEKENVIQSVIKEQTEEMDDLEEEMEGQEENFLQTSFFPETPPKSLLDETTDGFLPLEILADLKTPEEIPSPIQEEKVVVSPVNTVNDFEITEAKTRSTLFFYNNPESIDLDLSEYEDGELIGYNEKGVRFNVQKDGDYVAFTSTTSLGPRGEILGTSMSPDDYTGWTIWLDSQKDPEERENKTSAISGEEQVSIIEDEISLEQYRVIPNNSPQNYKYMPDHKLYSGGAKTKFKANVEAIKTLKLLEEEQREASPEEQITLAGFVGWGGLANALTENKAGWEKEYDEITQLLTETEFKSAQESTLTAYYTEQMVVGKMYQALENAGFKQGSILD